MTGHLFVAQIVSDFINFQIWSIAIAVEVKPYKVKKGDSLWNIVKAAGFPPKDWEKIYNAPYNSRLKSKIKKEKRTPDLIFPGEIVFLPAFSQKDVKKQIAAVKELKKTMDKIGMPLPVLEKLIGNLKKEKGAVRAKKEAALKDLTKKRNELDALIVEGAGKFKPGEHGDKFRIIATRYIHRRGFGVHDMTKKITEMRKNLESSKFDTALKSLEDQVKKARKDITDLSKALAEEEKKLNKMSQKPY
ncbi:MAG: hypothetical protein AAF393_00385 [Pseudomonadota bacterium]